MEAKDVSDGVGVRFTEEQIHFLRCAVKNEVISHKHPPEQLEFMTELTDIFRIRNDNPKTYKEPKILTYTQLRYLASLIENERNYGGTLRISEINWRNRLLDKLKSAFERCPEVF